jgi:hypothetical protein
MLLPRVLSLPSLQMPTNATAIFIVGKISTRKQLIRVPAVNRRDSLDWPPLFRQGGVTPATFFSYLLLRIQFSCVEVSDEQFAS